MFFRADLSQRIAKAFNEKVGFGAQCPLCQNRQFTIAEGFALIKLYDAYPAFLTGNQTERAIPCAAAVCTKCGNTFWISLITLGFGQEIKEWEENPFSPFR